MRKGALILAALVLAWGCGSNTTVESNEENGPKPFFSDLGFGYYDDAGSWVAVDAGHDTFVPGNENCEDPDGDGYGPKCAMGPDCDINNPKLNVYCPPCENGIYQGCPCVNEGSSIACYSGDPAFLGIGVCQAGQQQCINGYWTQCTGSIEPVVEVCDYKDNDCDNEIDEGVLSPCGDCNEKCIHMGVGPAKQEAFDLTLETSSGVGENVDGYIVLDSEKVNMQFIWIANSSENTVSKLDTSTGKETGRYKVCGNPSRTSVDLYGDVWVGCRSGGGVAKIRAYKMKCEDKNANGSIETSEDANGNGVIEGGEMIGGGEGADECVQFIVNPGGSCQRALGVDKDNHAWVGEWGGQVLRRLTPDTGEVVQEIGIPANPYGLVIDKNGVIWVSGRGGNKLVRVDPATGNVQAYQPNIGDYSPYGITLDNKGRIWTANLGSTNVAYRFDPTNSSWAKANTAGRPRGIVGSLEGMIYVANDEESKVAIVNADSMQTLGYINLGGGRFPVGITVDFAGYIWAVNQTSASATKINSATWEIVGEYPVGSGPYTYSDMTGYLLHTFTNPTGYYIHEFGGEGLRLVWTAIIIDATVPNGTYIKARVRAAVDQNKLESTPWSDYFGPFPPQTFPLDISELGLMGAYLQVEVSLYTEEDGLTPIVKSIEVKFESGEGGV
jgi:hypothetical protein